MFQAMDPKASLVSKVSRKNYLSFLRSFLSLISKWVVALLFSNVLVNLKLSAISLDENGRLITVLVQKLSLIQNSFIAIVQPSRRRFFEGGAKGEISRPNGGKRGDVVPWRSNRMKGTDTCHVGFGML